ncbi:MAG: folate-binding protein [Corticimicrobacter sp.]|uniref:CAF17-like 4Fe-4S cluster assembly/insertion protein YgfZ n=1 Tax=Corticimicrobacter sp. TaxID=2678536 RepID=UPI0032DB6807
MTASLLTSLATHARIARLTDFCVIRAQGEDAFSFLHGQMTQDISGLTAGQARLAGYCSPKGRMLASMLVWRHEGANGPEVVMLLSRSIAAAIHKRLSMFVLRAKVRLLIEDNAPVLGCSLAAADSAVCSEGLPDTTTAMPDHAWALQQVDGLTLIGMPAGSAGVGRWLVIDAAAQDAETLPATLQSALSSQAEGPALAATQDWLAEDIRAGLPWIVAATQDMFIPQSLDFELIGGVNFRKGCYPGQEVVARSHYRTTVKRRMTAGCVTVPAGLETSTDSLPGLDICRQDDAGAFVPEGRVINAARQGDVLHLLFEAPLALMDGPLYLQPDALGSESAAGLIAPAALPYSLEGTAD